MRSFLPSPFSKKAQQFLRGYLDQPLYFKETTTRKLRPAKTKGPKFTQRGEQAQDPGLHEHIHLHPSKSHSAAALCKQATQEAAVALWEDVPMNSMTPAA